MCAAAPEVAPFMADESVLAVPGTGKLDYTQKHYLAYAEQIKEKANELSKLGLFATLLRTIIIIISYTIIARIDFCCFCGWVCLHEN